MFPVTGQVLNEILKTCALLKWTYPRTVSPSFPCQSLLRGTSGVRIISGSWSVGSHIEKKYNRSQRSC